MPTSYILERNASGALAVWVTRCWSLYALVSASESRSAATNSQSYYTKPESEKRPPSRIISCSKPSRARRKPTTPLPVWTRVRRVLIIVLQMRYHTLWKDESPLLSPVSAPSTSSFRMSVAAIIQYVNSLPVCWNDIMNVPSNACSTVPHNCMSANCPIQVDDY